MLNLFQHLIKSTNYETLKQVQGDRNSLFSNLIINGDVKDMPADFRLCIS